MINFVFDGWEPVLRILLVGTVGYLSLVMLLRVSGKRTLAQMNGFDFVITVAVGASFGRILTAREVPIVEAVVTFALLMTLQYVVAKLQLLSPRFSSFVTSSPTLLVYRGDIDHAALRRERFTETELLGAVRAQGLGSVQDAEVVVLESDGGISVVSRSQAGNGSALNSLTPPK